MNNLKSAAYFAVPIAMAAVLFMLVVGNRQEPRQTPVKERVKVVRVQTISARAFTPRVSGFGEVAPAREWNAVAQVGGPVEFVHPELRSGAIISEGTQIIRISKAQFEISLRQAQADVAAAQAKLGELTAQLENTQASLQIENRSLQLKQTDLGRKKRLLSRGTTSQSNVDTAEAAVLSQQARVQDLRNTARNLDSQVKTQESQIAVNETRVEQAQLDLQRTTISAPYDVRVETVSVEPTQYVTGGTTMATAYGIDVAEVSARIGQDAFRAFVRLAIPDGDIAPDRLQGPTRDVLKKLGWTAKVTLAFANGPVSWDAELVRTAETIDPQTRTVGAIVAVDAPYANVRPGVRPPLVKGMFVEVEIEAQPIADSIVIPRVALHGEHVWIANRDNRLERRAVAALAEQGDEIVIGDGLAKGDRLVLTDIAPAIDGMLLSPQEAGTPGQDLSSTQTPPTGTRFAGREIARPPVAGHPVVGPQVATRVADKKSPDTKFAGAEVAAQ